MEIKALLLQPVKCTTAWACSGNSVQHSAAQCNTVQHSATQCNTVQHSATQCNTVQHTATHCNTVQHTATQCSTEQHTTYEAHDRLGVFRQDPRKQIRVFRAAVAVCCSVLQCVAACCSVLQCVAVCCSVLQYCKFVYPKILRSTRADSSCHCCSVMQCVAVCCSALHCVAVCCSVLPCVAVCCRIVCLSIKIHEFPGRCDMTQYQVDRCNMTFRQRSDVP